MFTHYVYYMFRVESLVIETVQKKVDQKLLKRGKLKKYKHLDIMIMSALYYHKLVS